MFKFINVWQRFLDKLRGWKSDCRLVGYCHRRGYRRRSLLVGIPYQSSDRPPHGIVDFCKCTVRRIFHNLILVRYIPRHQLELKCLQDNPQFLVFRNL